MEIRHPRWHLAGKNTPASVDDTQDVKVQSQGWEDRLG